MAPATPFYVPAEIQRAENLSGAAGNLLLTAREDDFVAGMRLVLKSHGRWLTVAEAAKLATMSVRSYSAQVGCQRCGV